MEDVKECKSILSMEDLCFSEINYKVVKAVTQRLEIMIGIKYRKEDANQVVILNLTAKTEDNSVSFYVELIGKFQIIDGEELSEDVKEQLLTENTVSMMMPYLRTQVSLLTTQPGLKPILLDPIDVSKLVRDEIAKGAKEY